MFVERLTKEEVQEFLGEDTRLNSLQLDKSTCTDEVSLLINTTAKKTKYNYSDYDFNHRLTDMDGISSDTRWRQFLYKKFGEEYKEWYIEQHLKIFE